MSEGYFGAAPAGVPAAQPGQPYTAGAAVEQAGQAPAGLGVTGIDIDQLAAQIRDMQARLDAADATAAAGRSDPLRAHVASVAHFLAGHGDPRAVELGADLAEAAGNAADSGDGAYASKAAARLVSHLERHAPSPGTEAYFYNNALHFARDTQDHIDALEAPARPANTVEGAVVG